MMTEESIEVPQWIVSKIGSLSLENDILRQENISLRNYIESISTNNEEVVSDE